MNQLFQISHREDRNGQLMRAAFFHSQGFGLYFERDREGPGWQVEIYERDDEPDERCLVLHRHANSARNAVRIAAAWWSR